MSFSPNNLLITGGAGFIGSNFVHHWLKQPGTGQVVVLDALTYAGNLSSLDDAQQNPRFVFVKGDICDEANVLDLLVGHNIDTVVHFAAESHVDRSILGPDEFVRTNVVGTHALLKAAKTAWLDRKLVPAHRFHQVSTDEVYGSLKPDAPAFDELTPYAPNSPYSATKAGSDHLVRAYHETYGLATTVTNCSNNYGPYQFPEKLIPLTIVNILAGKPLPVYGDGLQIRDWLYAEDHCRAIDMALTSGQPGQVYNIGGASETTNIDIIRTLCELTDDLFAADAGLRHAYPHSPGAGGVRALTLVEHVRDRPGHDRRYAIDFGKARGELGYEPQLSLANGLRQTLAWYLANTSWWQPLLDAKYSSWIRANYAPPLPAKG